MHGDPAEKRITAILKRNMHPVPVSAPVTETARPSRHHSRLEPLSWEREQNVTRGSGKGGTPDGDLASADGEIGVCRRSCSYGTDGTSAIRDSVHTPGSTPEDFCYCGVYMYLK